MATQSDDFVFDEKEISNCISTMKQAKKLIEDSYYMACKCSVEIKSNKEIWDGESRNTMAAYMELCTEYHKYFVDSGVLIGGERENAVSEAIKALEEAHANATDFYSKCQDYKYVENI